MKILFDQGTPAPLRHALPGHAVSTAYEMGWASLTNGDLLDAAERSFDVLVTTDQNLSYQQNLTGRRLAVLILPTTTSWPMLKERVRDVDAAAGTLEPGSVVRLPAAP
jgi:predicted nuclease of predicted toxin-antitoxin system